MTNPTLRELLARLAAQDAQVADLGATVRAQGARLARYEHRRRHSRPLPLALVALLVALVPLSLLAAHPFTDLTGGVHDANIDAIFNAGITNGCVPPPDPNPRFCPTATVTREEMASFLARLGGLGANKPVANAARLGVANPVAGGATYAANELVRVSRNSEDSADANVIIPGAETPVPTVVATVAINKPPGNGFILVNANTMFRFSGCAGCTMTATLGGATAQALSVEAALVPVSLTWVFPSNDESHNLGLFIKVTRPGQVAPIPSGTASNPNMTAIFVPFDRLGGTNLDLP